MTEQNSSIKKVLVIGDSNLATNIVSSLSSNPSLLLHQTTQPQSSLQSSPEITIHKLDDTNPSSLFNLFKLVEPDILFSKKSPGSFEYQKGLIDSAILAGIPRFEACEWGLDTLTPGIQARLPPYSERGKTLSYLQSRQAEENQGGRFEWVALATGYDLEKGLLKGGLGFDITWHSATIPSSGDEIFAASSSSWPGVVANSLIEHWEEVRNRYLYAPGLVTKTNSILEELERQTERKWTTGRVEVEDMLREAERRVERGFLGSGAVLLERGVLFDSSLDGVRPFMEDDLKNSLALKGEELEGIVGKVLHQFTHHGKGGCGCD